MKKRNNLVNMQKDTSRQFIFTCCVLFFFFISISSFLSEHCNNEKNLYLFQSSDGFLSLSENQDKTVTLPQLTPFFFKPLPINSCDTNLLLSVSGIGPRLAGNILYTRNQIGYFSDMYDLLKVRGIGKSRMIKFSKFFSFEFNSPGNSK